MHTDCAFGNLMKID